MYKFLLGLLVLLSATPCHGEHPPLSSERLFPAFPGAEGAGAYTPGGRGGKVFLVTTLGDYAPSSKGGRKKAEPIPGSLRAAVEAEGPRVILFRVAGNIDLAAPLVIRNPYITITGQTAPGDGICLRNWSLELDTHDVIIRYLRVRPGDVMRKELDGISCSGHNVIIDHCSVSFGIDETLSTNGDSGNVTVQWTLITESLNGSVHHKGAHGYGSLISGVEPITYHHNLYAFHRSRNPRPGIGLLDFRNNVIYGWGDRAGYCGNDMLQMNYVNNYLRPGAFSKDQEYAFSPGGPSPRIYIDGNWFAGKPEKTRNNKLLIKPPDDISQQQAHETICVTRPFPTNTVTTDTAEKAYERVLNEAGATLPIRDTCDQRVVEWVRTGAGRIINSQQDVGGWPELGTGVVPPDSDGDGISDDWERQNGLAPADPVDASKDCSGDGFTNIEKYLYGLNPHESFAWIFPPGIVRNDESNGVGPARISLVSTTPDVEIRYTLDGDEPTQTSPVYHAPFEVKQTTMIRAKAFKGSVESHVMNQRVEILEWREAVRVERTANGVDYAYYENGEWSGFPDLAAIKPVRTGSTENFGFAPASAEAGYGLKFSGYVRIPEDGIYTFCGRSTELSRLQIDDAPPVMTQSRKREKSERLALKAGLHRIELSAYFRAADDNRTLEVSYEGPGISRQIVPAENLFRDAP